MNTELTSDRLNAVKNKIKDASPKSEGKLTKAVEKQTAKTPSITWLSAAVGSMVLSGALQFFSTKKELSNFIGTWAPCFLMLGIYNKIVKTQGSELNETSDSMFESVH